MLHWSPLESNMPSMEWVLKMYAERGNMLDWRIHISDRILSTGCTLLMSRGHALQSLGMDTAPHICTSDRKRWHSLSKAFPSSGCSNISDVTPQNKPETSLKRLFSNCALRSPKGSAGMSRGHNREGPKRQHATGGGPRASNSSLTQWLWFQLFLYTGVPLGLQKRLLTLKETKTKNPPRKPQCEFSPFYTQQEKCFR